MTHFNQASPAYHCTTPLQSSRLPYSSDAGDDPMASSYTATSDSIRDSTAQLAGMAIEDHSTTDNTTSRIEEDDENQASSSPDGRLHPFVAPRQPVHPSSLSRSYGALSSSNLRKVLDASRPTTPEQPTFDQAVEANEAPESSHRADERTTLLPPRGRRDRSRSTLSRSRSRRKESSDSEQEDTMASGFSIASLQAEAGYPRSSYGRGALAQASLEAEAAGRRGDESYASLGQRDEETEGQGIDDTPQRNEVIEPGQQSRRGWPKALLGWRSCSSPPSASATERLQSVKTSLSKLTWRDVLEASAEPVRLLPATVLGVLMNILDGVSYGLITFPTTYPIFSEFGGDGVSMFFVTCIISQLVFSLGGSIFRGGNGSMMIEVVPFYHILCTTIIETIGDENPKSVVATTMVAFALSSIFTGLAFLLLGVCKLGVLIGFFPRHILVGCIGGVGVFLLETGFEVSGRLEAEKGFQYDLETLKYFLQSWSMIALWGTPLMLAIVLRIVTTKIHHPLVMPAYFISITPIFYLIAVVGLGKSLEELRYAGWIFDIGAAGDAPFYRYFTYLDFSQTSLRAIWNTMPTMISLTFFSVLHVPLNVPALAVSLKEDNVVVDHELTGHGVSNLIAGALATVPNYLCFSNTLLFYRVGGGSRLSGIMLAGATAVVMIVGPGMINYLNVSTVGALIFLLGIDLCKEAVWDTIGTTNRWEYLTIWFIIVVMSLADFVIGILAGICVACLFLTIQMSRRKTVRACFDGSVARSTVRRPMAQRKFLEVVGTQTQILKLQGFLFFATINSVEALIRRALDIATWQQKPMRFLVVDFALVSGIDFSAAEAFTRIQRLLQAKDVVLVFCGLSADAEIGVALRNLGLWADQGLKIEAFPSLNEALEWTENSYLRGMYLSSLKAGKQLKQASLGGQGALNVPDSKRAPAFVLDEAFENSPRRHHLHEAAKTAVARGPKAGTHGLRRDSARRDDSVSGADVDADYAKGRDGGREGGGNDAPADNEGGKHHRESVFGGLPANTSREQPLPLLMVTFGSYVTSSTELDECFFQRLCKYFKRIEFLKDELVWQQGDDPDGLYLIESGALKARYDFEQKDFEINEAMLAGTIAGELSFLSRQVRDTSARAELNSVLWKLDEGAMRALEREESETFSLFVSLLVRVAVEEQSSLMNYLVSRLS